MHEDKQETERTRKKKKKMNERSIEGNEFNGYEWSFRERGGFKDEYGGYKERKVVTGKRLVGYEVGDE